MTFLKGQVSFIFHGFVHVIVARTHRNAFSVADVFVQGREVLQLALVPIYHCRNGSCHCMACSPCVQVDIQRKA